MDLKQISHVAEISKLEFSEENLQAISNDFNETLDMIALISQVDVDNIRPTVHVHDYPVVLRSDERVEGLTQNDAIKNTKETQYGYVKILKFVE